MRWVRIDTVEISATGHFNGAEALRASGTHRPHLRCRIRRALQFAGLSTTA